MSKKPQSILANRLKRDTDVQIEEHEEKAHYVDKIIESSPAPLENDTKKDIENDIKFDINKDIKIVTKNNTKIDNINDIKKDIKINTNNNINIVIKKDIKNDIKIKKLKSGFHCHLNNDYILAINELKKVTGKYKDDLAQEAYELLFKKYGVDIQHIE